MRSFDGKRRQTARCALLGFFLLAAADGAAGGFGAPVPGAASTLVAQRPSEPPWTPVHPERRRRLVGVSIGAVCFDGIPPRKLAGKPPDLPASSVYRRHGGVLIAHCLVDDEGYVVEAQLWKMPDPADRQAVARALASWRFAPARRRDGRPSAVHFTVSIPVARDAARGASSVMIRGVEGLGFPRTARRSCDHAP